MTGGGADGLARIIDRTRHLLLDFDGPICNVFAGLPAAGVATRLRDLLGDEGVTLPAQIASEHDPIEVPRFTASLGPEITERIESALREAEVAASGSAKPTPHVQEVIVACHQTGRSLAVVSNNSTAAVKAYLSRHDLAKHVDAVAGRSEPDPAFLKPSPHLLVQAMRLLSADPRTCALVGDSISDIQAAHAIGIRSIGYANKPGKHGRLNKAGADAVVTTMADVAAAIRRTPVESERSMSLPGDL